MSVKNSPTPPQPPVAPNTRIYAEGASHSNIATMTGQTRGGGCRAAKMPKYYAKSTSITLSVADLFASTTAVPLKNLSPIASRNTHHAAEQLAVGPGVSKLSETPVSDGGSHVRFLGGDMPFFLTHASKNSNHRTYIKEPPQPDHAENETSIVQKGASSSSQDSRASSVTPLALCVTVSLSKASFLKHYVATLQRTITEDIKIDVFLNGELCASTYMSERYCDNDAKEFIQRFSGQRIDRLLENPWVLTLPSQATDVHEHGAYPAKERWDEIGGAIELQAMRFGGKTTVLGEYLSHIADLEMPAEVKTMQRQGALKFAIVDVVISTGKGQKNEKQNDPWLKAPTPMRLKRPLELQALQGKENKPRIIRRTPVVKNSTQEASSSRFGGLSIAPPHSGQHTAGTTLANISQSSNGSQSTPRNQNSPRWEPTSKWRGAPTRADEKILAQGQLVLSGPRTRTTYNNNASSNSSMAACGSARKQPASSPTPAPRPRTTKGKFGKPPETSAPIPEISQKLHRDTEEDHGGPPMKRQRMQYHHVFDNKMTLSEEMVIAEAAGREGHSVGRLLKHIETKQGTAPVAASDAEVSSTPQNTFKTNTSSAAFGPTKVNTAVQTPAPRKRLSVHNSRQNPSLSNDCVVGYANGPVRQIKMERSGWFEETGILMGVRYLIC